MPDSPVNKLTWPLLAARYRMLGRLDRGHHVRNACKDCISHSDGCCVYPFYDGWKILLLPHEIARISKHTGKRPADFADDSPLVNAQLEYYRENRDADPHWSSLFDLWQKPTGLKGKCPFLVPQGCTLPYDKKPFLCQVYPLTFNMTDNSIYRDEDPDCLLIQATSSAGKVLDRFKDSDTGLSSRFEEYRRDFYDLLKSLQ
jgi:Fe-S-cluster containining protein